MKKIDIPQDIDLYYNVFNSIASPIFIKDRLHRFVLVNDAFCEMFRVERHEILGKTEKPFFPVHEWTIYRKKDKKILETGMVDENEEFATVRGGKRLRLITRKSLLTTSDGVKYILGTITDITEKAAITQKLRESERKYKAVFNLGNDPGGIFNYPDHALIDVNQAFLQVSHATRKSIIGKTGVNAFTWSDQAERQKYFDLLETEHRVENMEIHLSPGQGSPRPYLVSACLEKIDGKRSVLFSLRDISSIKKSQEMLRDSIRLYETLVEKSPNIILIHTGCHVLYANKTFADYAGEKEEDLQGKALGEVFLSPASGSQKITINKVFGNSVNFPDPVEFETVNRNGTVKFFIMRSSRIRYQEKNVILSILTDITDSKNIDKLILGKINETEEMDRKRFAADLHDDLGPILSSINLQLGLLAKTTIRREYLQTVAICNDLLNEVISKISDISNNLMPRLLDDYGLHSAVSFLCKQMEATGNFMIKLSSNLHGRRFQPSVELHLYRIISELINNSIKHSTGNQITIQLQFKNNILTLLYADNGKGYKFDEVLHVHGGSGITNILFRIRLINAEIDFVDAKQGEIKLRIRKHFEPGKDLPA